MITPDSAACAEKDQGKGIRIMYNTHTCSMSAHVPLMHNI